MTNLFKGIYQVTKNHYTGLTKEDKLGYLFLVRDGEYDGEGNLTAVTSEEIYFGTRKYGDSSNEFIAKLIESFGGLLDSEGAFVFPVGGDEFKSFTEENVDNLYQLLKALDEAIVVGDEALSADIIAVSGATEANATEIEGLKTKIEGISGTTSGATADEKVKVEISQSEGKVTEVTVTGSDIASASALTEANNVITAHTGNTEIHVTTEDKAKWNAAEPNYVKSVGDNLNVDDSGKLTVTIPEVEVPFQSVAADDKILTLGEGGVLSSTLSYAREEVEGVDSLVLKGINGAVIGSIPVADFVADGMLESVTPEDGTNNFIFTFKTGNGTTESFKVDFSKYVDVYNAGSGLTLDNKEFAVDFEKVAKKEDLDAIIAKVGSEKTDDTDSTGIFAILEQKANSVDVYTKDEADGLFLTGITVDSELSSTSTNPVENQAVFAEFGKVRDEITSAITGDVASALVNYARKDELNTLNNIALYGDSTANIEIIAGNGTIIETSGSTITVDVKVSEDENNAISLKEDGLWAQAIIIDGNDVETI